MKNDNMPLISVVVAVYNLEQYIIKCIESIIEQTYKNLEIIIIDDGSIDNSGELCDTLEKKDNRIIVIHKTNEGLVKARKTGLSIAKGEYVAFVDGDDYIMKDMYKELYDNTMYNGVSFDIVHSGYITSVGNIMSPSFQLKKDEYNCVEIIKKYVLGYSEDGIMTPSIWSKLFKKEIIKKCYDFVPDNQSMGEDLICLFACLCEGASVNSISKALYFYNIRQQSMSHNVTTDNLHDEIGIIYGVENVLNHYGYYEFMKEEMKHFFEIHIKDALRKEKKNYFAIQKYSFAEKEKIKNKKIIIYGAGEVGRDYYSELSRLENCQIVNWVDRDCYKYNYECCSVKPIDTIFNINYDYIIIANFNKGVLNDIRENLIDYFGINRECIIAELPNVI